MNVLDLFSGIGGFSLGLERAGMRTVAFCEIEPYPRAVLKKHWPQIPCYDDVRSLSADRLRADGIAVDVICGGFPCQDISVAGKQAGIEGERSGLWSEYARIIGEVRPRYVIVENVAALAFRGLDRVLGDLAALGYDAEWHCIPASAVGARHRRDRLWIIARQHSERSTQRIASGGSALADSERGRLSARHVRYDEGHPIFFTEGSGSRGWDQIGETWRTEPDVGRVAYGVPAAMERIKGLGNAVIPQIPEIIGRAILAQEAGADNG
jgi:DNA (cytosine-5)-methyltransferase 1